ncbi:MAG: hypothetical protein AAGI37_01345 [Planctomycetota bacterium]
MSNPDLGMQCKRVTALLRSPIGLDQLSSYFIQQIEGAIVCSYDPLARRVEAVKEIADQLDMSPRVRRQFVGDEEKKLLRWGQGKAIDAYIYTIRTRIEFVTKKISFYLKGDKASMPQAVDRCKEILADLDVDKVGEMELVLAQSEQLFRL